MSSSSKFDVSRRSFVQLSALSTGAFFINTKYTKLLLADAPASPATTPFIQALTFPPVKQPLPAGVMFDPLPIPEAHQRFEEFLPTKYYELTAREVLKRPHPQLGLSRMSTYDGLSPGPMFVQRCYDPIMVRIKNELPHEMQGYGSPEIITHLHNGNDAPESDGVPWELYGPGYFKDHHYPNWPSNGNPNECKGTLWYHDHCLDFTAQNTYRGLAGFYICFDQVDSGNETDPNPAALRLPSGLGVYDIPLAFSDRRFDQNGVLTFDPMDLDGYLGDKYLVNGLVQPYFNVTRRKYRFRMLDAGPSRFYDFWFSNQMEFQYIASDGNLLAHPITVNHLSTGPGERHDIVVDFSLLPESTREIYIVNRIAHATGRGPKVGTLPMIDSPRIMKINILPGAVPDPSRVPQNLRVVDDIPLENAVRKEWKWTRNNGMWSVNGQLFDEHRSDATVVQGQTQIWTFSTPGGWAHPIHFHVEEGRLLRYNGVNVQPNSILGGRKDVFSLYGGDEMTVALRYRDWIGTYVMHCHNGVHEDHAMMIKFDVVAPS